MISIGALRCLRETISRRIDRKGRAAAQSASEPQLDANSPKALAALGVEVWRFGRRIAKACDAGDRYQDSLARLVRALEDVGVRIDDPLGRVFVEGTTAEIVDMPAGIDFVNDTLVVANVLRPAVFVAGKCVVAPQIVVERQNTEEAA